MENISLSKRLKTAADFVKADETIVDIGSDHAYLPIYLIQKGKIPSAIAGEVVEGPYNKAVNQVIVHQLENKIDVRLGDGLEVLEVTEKVGTIFICGMGGLLISDIIRSGLEHKKISANVRLVLQANNAEINLRRFLMQNHFEIIAEAILEENHKIYEVIVAVLSAERITYTEEELMFGPNLLKDPSVVFIKKWRQEFEINQQILNRLKDTNNTEKIKELTKKNQQIRKVIS